MSWIGTVKGLHTHEHGTDNMSVKNSGAHRFTTTLLYNFTVQHCKCRIVLVIMVRSHPGP